MAKDSPVKGIYREIELPVSKEKVKIRRYKTSDYLDYGMVPAIEQEPTKTREERAKKLIENPEEMKKLLDWWKFIACKVVVGPFRLVRKPQEECQEGKEYPVEDFPDDDILEIYVQCRTWGNKEEGGPEGGKPTSFPSTPGNVSAD